MGSIAVTLRSGTGPLPESGTTYLFTDMLRSLRFTVDEAGSVEECYDYLPFGRMLSDSDNNRSALGCHPVNPDFTALDSEASQKFTGQIRDEETRLDYFKALPFRGDRPIQFPGCIIR